MVSFVLWRGSGLYRNDASLINADERINLIVLIVVPFWRDGHDQAFHDSAGSLSWERRVLRKEVLVALKRPKLNCQSDIHVSCPSAMLIVSLLLEKVERSF